MMTPYLKDITTHAWCIEHARPALGGAIPIGCAVAHKQVAFYLNQTIVSPARKHVSCFPVGAFCIPMCNNKTEKHMKNDYVAPELEIVEVLVEHGFVYTSADAFGEEGTVITPEF